MDYRNQLEYHLIVSSIMLKCHSMKDLKPTLKSVDQFNEFRKVGHELYKKEKLCSEKLTAIHETQSSKKCLKDQIFQSNGFKSIYASNSNLSVHLLRECALQTARMLMILSKFTSFFGENPLIRSYEEILQNESIMSIGLVFMKLRKKSYTNTFVYCGNSQSLVACSSHISSFISHSCNPNTKLCITDDQTLVLCSLQPIEENTQLSLSYHYAFYEEEKLARNDWMQDRTDPMCECEACRQTWPTLTQMYELPKVNPLIYAKRYLQEESDLFDEFDTLVRPIIQRDRHVRYDQATVKRLAKALMKAMESLHQPSVVISELMFCLSLTFEKLYGPSLRR
ncbi:hypothetical protein QAD02_006864 [Eretmocerus hayati]|uniref:Uncharacterized protein n=1 Tax=Eretmocerus hayati TaxID=131215 RepID=A0ACC2N4E8_9HYME|nr:hypothetical protein QAD02_006864 [Eretmocerus hayati]